MYLHSNSTQILALKKPVFSLFLVQKIQKDFLGEIPLDPEVGKQGDKGTPIVESNPNNEVSKIYLQLAEKIKTSYSVK